MRYVDVRRLRRAVEVAGLREFERAAHEIDGRGILEGEVVHVVRDHQKARVPAAARVIEPQEEHPCRQRDGPFLDERFVLALGVSVGVGYREQSGIALGAIVQRTGVRRTARGLDA